MVSETSLSPWGTNLSEREAQLGVSLGAKGKYIMLPDDGAECVTWQFYPESGIYRITEVIDKHGRDQSYTRQSIYWRDLKITEIGILEDEINPGLHYHYFSGAVNDQQFNKLDQSRLEELLFSQALNPRNSIPKGHVLLSKYSEILESLKLVPIINHTRRLGFIDKWYLPNEYRILPHPGIGEKICRQMEILFQTNYQPDLARKLLKLQYEVTTLPYKDIIFAWGLAAPFFYSLLKVTDLIPYIALWGDGDVGITRICKDISVKWWNHLGSDDAGRVLEALVSTTTLPNLREYISSVPLPILCDDLGTNWGRECLTLFKSYMTGSGQWEIKDKTSKQVVAMAYKAPLLFTFNQYPTIFNDAQLLMRGIVLKMKKAANEEEAKRYRETMRQMPSGIIGRHIYELSKKWTQESLILDYMAFARVLAPLHTENSVVNNRMNVIYTLLHFGKKLAKDWFDLDLNLTELPVLLNSTQKIGSEEIDELIQQQILNGKIEKDGAIITHWAEEYGKFKPGLDWIKNPIYPVMHNKKPGYLYTNINLRDLTNFMRTPIDEKWTLKQLLQLIRKFHPEAEIIDNPVKITDPFGQKFSVRGPIWIPKDSDNE